MASKKKSWAEKMKSDSKHKITVNDKDFADIPAGHSLLIPTPLIVDSYVRAIPEGTHTNIKQMRSDLAAEYGSEYSCPVVSGICLRIVAENAFELLQNGQPLNQVAPFWRMIDLKSPSAKKLACGVDYLAELRKKEGLPL